MYINFYKVLNASWHLSLLSPHHSHLYYCHTMCLPLSCLVLPSVGSPFEWVMFFLKVLLIISQQAIMLCNLVVQLKLWVIVAFKSRHSIPMLQFSAPYISVSLILRLICLLFFNSVITLMCNELVKVNLLSACTSCCIPLTKDHLECWNVVDNREMAKETIQCPSKWSTQCDCHGLSCHCSTSCHCVLTLHF